MAERVGFEPTAHCCVTGFQDQLLKPLGHLSKCRSEDVAYYTQEKYNCQSLFYSNLAVRGRIFANVSQCAIIGVALTKREGKHYAACFCL